MKQIWEWLVAIFQDDEEMETFKQLLKSCTDNFLLMVCFLGMVLSCFTIFSNSMVILRLAGLANALAVLMLILKAHYSENEKYFWVHLLLTLPFLGAITMIGLCL